MSNKIYCPACNKEIGYDKEGHLNTHFSSDTLYRDTKADGARCSGSGVHWEVAASSTNAHLEVGAVVRIGRDELARPCHWRHLAVYGGGLQGGPF